MTNFITIDGREYNVSGVWTFGIVEDDDGNNILEIETQSGNVFEFTDDEAEHLYTQLMAVKASGEADAFRLAKTIEQAEAYVAELAKLVEAARVNAAGRPQ